jgi:hypothetical protein
LIIHAGRLVGALIAGPVVVNGITYYKPAWTIYQLCELRKQLVDGMAVAPN